MDSHFPRRVLIGFIPPLLFFYFILMLDGAMESVTLDFFFFRRDVIVYCLKRKITTGSDTVIEFYLVFDLNLIDI